MQVGLPLVALGHKQKRRELFGYAQTSLALRRLDHRDRYSCTGGPFNEVVNDRNVKIEREIIAQENAGRSFDLDALRKLKQPQKLGSVSIKTAIPLRYETLLDVWSGFRFPDGNK